MKVKKDNNCRALQVTLSLFVALGVCTMADAQQPDFLFTQSYPYEWQYGGVHSLEIVNGHNEPEGYIVAACDIATIGYVVGGKSTPNKDDISPPAKVIKLSPEGEVVRELVISDGDKSSSIIALFNDPSNPKFCLSIGIVLDSTSSYTMPYLAKFDLDLNLAWFKKIDVPELHGRVLMGGRSLIDSHGDIVLCTYPSANSGSSNLAYIRLSSEGELLAHGISTLECSMFYLAQGGLFEYKDGTGDYGQTFVGMPEGYSNPPVYFVRMDRNFTDFQTHDLLENIRLSETDGVFVGDYYSQAYTASLQDGTKYLSTRGIRYDGYLPEIWDEVIVSMKLDHNDSIVNISFIPHEDDSVRTLAFCQGMDQSTDGNFFVCNGVYDNEYWQIGELDGLNRFTATKLDADANIIWTRFYEDHEHVFQPCAVMATHDGGCLVTGRCWTMDHQEALLFALKILADGSLSLPETESLLRPYMSYPNPVQDQLHLQYSPDVQPRQIELYDLQGRLVRSQSNAFETVDLSLLPTGTYTMRVTMKDGHVFSDKVVKE